MVVKLHKRENRKFERERKEERRRRIEGKERESWKFASCCERKSKERRENKGNT